MKILSILSILLLVPVSAQAVHCTGYHEYFDESNQYHMDSVDLTLEFEDKDNHKFSGDLDQVHYMVLAGKTDEEILMMVTIGPNYTEGVTASMFWSNDKSARISRVDGNTVYRLVCLKEKK